MLGSSKNEALKKENLILREKIDKIKKSFNNNSESLHNILVSYININEEMKNYSLPKIIFKRSNIREVTEILEENKGLSNEYIKLIYLMKRLIQVMKVKNISLEVNRPYFKLLYDKLGIPICLVAEINKELDGSIKNIRIFGATGDLENYHKYEDTFIECYIHLINQYSDGILAFITKIDVKHNYRIGRGTLVMEYIEEELLREVERIMIKYYKENGYKDEYGKINRIGGYIANVGHTTMEENKAFYNKLGYDVMNRSFNKTYKKVETI